MLNYVEEGEWTLKIAGQIFKFNPLICYALWYIITADDLNPGEKSRKTFSISAGVIYNNI